MKTKLLISLLVGAAISIALIGWAIQGIRWTLSGWYSRPRVVTA